MSIRFIHSADWQLGMTRHFLQGEAQARFTQARLDAVRRLGELALEHDAAFIVVAGDIFESHQLTPGTLGRALATIGELPVPTVLLPGNHDPLNAGSIWRGQAFARLATATVKLVAEDTPLEIVPGVEIVGGPWRNKRPVENPLSAAIEPLSRAPGIVRIALGHGAVDSLTPDLGQPGVLRLSDIEAWLAADKVNYVALGDRHSLTEIGSTGRVFYSGAPEPTDFGEQRPGKALLVEFASADQPPRTQALDTATWCFVQRDDWELDAAADVDAVAGWLDSQGQKERCIVKLAARGSLPLQELARFEALLEDQRELFAALLFDAKRSDVALAANDPASLALPVQGFARDACEALGAAAAADDEAGAAARDALVLLQRLLGAGRS